MKILPIPIKSQIEAMLSGTVYDLASQYHDNPSKYNLKNYLTINRSEVVDYLRFHEDDTLKYFKNKQSMGSTCDVECIWKENECYFVGTMDHGKPRFVRKFNDISEAVAEYILVSYGMY